LEPYSSNNVTLFNDFFLFSDFKMKHVQLDTENKSFMHLQTNSSSSSSSSNNNNNNNNTVIQGGMVAMLEIADFELTEVSMA
jgi:hypothetical protein